MNIEFVKDCIKEFNTVTDYLIYYETLRNKILEDNIVLNKFIIYCVWNKIKNTIKDDNPDDITLRIMELCEIKEVKE